MYNKNLTKMNKITLILLFISITFISCMGDVKPNISVENDINLTIDGENIDGVQGRMDYHFRKKKRKRKGYGYYNH